MISTLNSNQLLFQLHRCLLPLLNFKSTHADRISYDIWAVTLGLRKGCLIDRCHFSEAASRSLSSKLQEVESTISIFFNPFLDCIPWSHWLLCCFIVFAYSFTHSLLHLDAQFDSKFINLSSRQIRAQDEPPAGFSDSICHIRNNSVTNSFQCLDGFGSDPVTIAGWLIGYPFLYITPKEADWVWKDAHLRVINYTLMGSQSEDFNHQLMAFSIPSDIESQLDFEAILLTLKDKINEQIRLNGSNLSIWNHVTYSTQKVDMDQVAL